MAVSSINYPNPVYVNGFSCRNCSEVAQAERNIDPANPEAGPNGINDPKKTEQDFFSPEARNLERLEQLHLQQVRPNSAVAAAYSDTPRTQGGSIANVSA